MIKMAENKITKRVVLNHIIDTYADDMLVVNYARHELELLDKKSENRTPSKNQIANEGIKSTIVDTLVELAKPSTIADIQGANAELGALSNQKVSALLTQLVNANAIVRTVDKKKAYFSVVTE